MRVFPNSGSWTTHLKSLEVLVRSVDSQVSAGTLECETVEFLHQIGNFTTRSG